MSAEPVSDLRKNPKTDFTNLRLPGECVFPQVETQEMGDKKKAGALFVKLVSTAGTGFFYVVKKTKRLQTSQTKLEFRKYDPRVNSHVLFKEEKMK
ncbi:hypothetical protein DM860_009169 [Cuscuta australis]|uniref:Ribosomal protein L33 n=1 Tax=Cuscuta australis TaxID=267555 RepID=A0A328D9W8_9ASTE|nr:hypothetical protein DM860_009169 [Cuscuta australis]